MTARRDRETLDYEDRLERIWEKQGRNLLAEAEFVCTNRHKPQAMILDDTHRWSCPWCGAQEDDLK